MEPIKYTPEEMARKIEYDKVFRQLRPEPAWRVRTPQEEVAHINKTGVHTPTRAENITLVVHPIV